MIKKEVSIAPMMGYTDRHARFFLRLISRRCVLYTEMITTGALLNGDKEKFLAYDKAEHPLVLQLGGSNPEALTKSAQLAEKKGFDEINLNLGCPSDRVKNGSFGASLMLQPKTVVACIDAMQNKVKTPVTVKCRIGVDEMDSYDTLENFVHQLAETGCNKFIIHARKAWLKGLSPKQNREIPPLHYDYVYRLKQKNPELFIVINGGIKNLAAINVHLKNVDGVMIGREAYHNPYLLAEIDNEIFNANAATITREEIVQKVCHYAEGELNRGIKLHAISRHILGLFQGCAGAKAWRRYLSENSHYENADTSVIKTALEIQQSKQ